MPSSTKNASKENNSNLTNTLAHETGMQSTLTISSETHALIKCLESLNNHWEQTCDALQKVYSEKETYELMNEKYNPVFYELKSVLQSFILSSIEYNMGLIGANKI